MLHRIGNAGGEVAETLRHCARESVDKVPLNVSDHLCCANSAIVEYYLTTGDIASTGDVLAAMYERKQKEGSYRYHSYNQNNGVTASLFYWLCGINSVNISGGEPMLHKNFMDIIREVYKRGMTVFTTITNGYFITQEILDELKDAGCNTEMRMSFDGIGTHDWIRNFNGAEKSLLKTIKLCVDNGFSVFINTQVHRRNVHTMMPTARLLNDMGVKIMRIIRTTEVPRWVHNASNANLSIEEYYESMLRFSEEYIKSDMTMNIAIWQYLSLNPKERNFSIFTVQCPDGTYHDNCYCCDATSQMFAVTSAGEVVTCVQGSGVFMKYGISLGNIHNTPLKDILNSSPYIDMAKMTVGNFRKNSTKCGKCKYFKFCCGGCRGLGMLLSKDASDVQHSLQNYFSHEDVTKCYFFENGWYQKITQALSDWNNLSKVSNL